MKRKRSRLWKRGTALLLAATMVLGDLGAAAAVGPEQTDLSSIHTADTVMNAVYGPEGGGSINPLPPVPFVPEPVTAGEPLSWNLLTKIDRSKIPSIYHPEDQVLKMSADGRYIAFKRLELVTEEPAHVNQMITVYDRKTGAMDDIQSPSNSLLNDEVLYFDLSSDARYVAFSYKNSTEDWKERTKVYLYDRETRNLTPITTVEGSTDSRDGTDRVAISADGRYVAFDSDAPGIVPEDNDDLRDVFVYDRERAATKRISTQPGMGEYDLGDSEAPSISADGRYIAFQSDAKFVEKDTYGQRNIYVYDREDSSARPQLASMGAGGTAGEGDSTLPSISADGSVIAYESRAENLDPGDTNEVKDIFVYHRNTLATKRISLAEGGIPFNRESLSPSISRDGRYVGFHLDYVSVEDTDDDHDNDEENDIPEQAYVADVASQTAYQVAVPQAPYPLVQPSQSPLVGDGGKLVAYLSEYLYSYGSGSEGIPFPGIFIAEKGEAPAWPAGSKLEASNHTNNSVALSWPDAVDASGVLGYHVYQDGKNIGYVEHRGAGSSTFTAQGLLPGIESEFQVEAVNTAYRESYGGPTYKLGSGGGENPAGGLRVQWDVEEMRNGLAFPGSKVGITAYGEPGKQAEAALTYIAWENETEQDTRTVPITLTESAPGTYTGWWKMENGVSQMTSLNVRLTDPAKPGTILEKPADGFPVSVAGAVKLTFTNPSGASLAGSMLTASSRQYGEQITLLPNSDAYVVNGLYPGKDYSFTLRSPDGRHTWGKLEQVQAAGGKVSTAGMNIEQPANIRFQVVDPTGQPVSGVEVQLFGPDQSYIDASSTYGDGWTPWTDYLKAGDSVTAKVNIGDRMYDQPANQDILLKPGTNEPVIKLRAPGEGVLEGFVKGPDGKGVRNAYVTSTQTFKGQPVVRRARTNLEGAYRLSLLKGEAKMEVVETSYLYSTAGPVTAQVTEGGTTTLDLAVKQPGKGVVNTEVRLKYLEDTDFGPPVNMEEMAFLTRIESKRGWMSGYFQNAHQFYGSPGDTVSVCVTGSIPAYMTSCTDVVLDQNSNATAKLFLEEKGARIQGKLAQTHHRWVSGGLYKLQEQGYRSASSYLSDNDFEGDGSFHINVPEAGTYVMELSGALPGSPLKYEYATVQFTVSDRQILQVGSVSFSSKSYFSNYYGNYYNAVSSRIAPGGTVTLRAGYKNSSSVDASEVKLLIDIPEGTTPVKDAAGRIVVSGVQLAVDPVLDGQTLILPVGTVAQKQSGTLSFQLKVDPAFNKSSAKSSARIRATMGAEPIEESIGSILLDAPLVTLEAPERVSRPADSSTPVLKLSGVAPAGSQVKVYDGKLLLGSVAASGTGFWLLAAQDLPDLGDPGVHAIRAEVDSGAVKLQSPVSYVHYDTVKPQLLELAMAQAPEGRWVTLNLREGIPNLPYTVVPGNPFQFELKFDKPDEVENVEIYLEGQSGEPVKAVREGGIFRALTPTDKGALGAIYVDYDVKPKPFVLDDKQPTLEELRETLPPAMRDFVAEVTSPFELQDGKYAGTVQMTFPQLPGLKITEKLSISPDAKYTASPQEIELAQRSGLPMLNGSVRVTETGDGFKTVTSGYMPMKLLFPSGIPGSLKSALAAKVRALAADEGPDFGTLADVSVETYVQYGEGGEDAGTVYKIKKQYEDSMEFAEKINKIAYKVEASGMDCIQELPTTVKQAGKALVAVVGGEIGKVALGAWTGAMGLTGPGAIAAAGASAVIEDKIDNYVDEQIDSIGTGYNQCRDEDEDEKKKRKRKKIARLRWIYDPSGFVYEAVPANRLSGVKATVLYQQPATKEWVVWDAGPYEQVNPHNTDDQGKYGWDVPEGKWKVVWEKDGYETKSSAELDVPPPHTEVNAGLVSYAAPKVQSVTGVSGSAGSYVDIELSKYVKVTDAAAAAQAITVTGPDGPLEGSISFVQPVDNPADPDGADLSKIIRFTSKTALKLGAGYGVKVTAGFQSYAGVWMTDTHTGSFEVRALDEEGPTAAADEVSAEGEGSILRITFNEKLGGIVDAAKFTLNGSRDRIVSAVKALKPNPAGEQLSADGEYERTVVLTLSDPLAPGTEAQLGILAGAVTDAAGNGAAEKTLKAVNTAGASRNAALASLAVEEGALTPAFDPSVRSYKVQVPQAAETVTLTASLADASARLVIDGTAAANGARRTVQIPSTGSIAVRVTAADGVTVREYSVEVVRGATDPLGTEAALSALEVTPGTLSPVFDPAVETYAVEVAANATELQVTATAKDPQAKSVSIAGEAAVSGTAKTVAIPAGGQIEVVVTAEDGAAKRTYKIAVNRETDTGGGSGGDNSGNGGSTGSSGGGSTPPAQPVLTQAEAFTSASGGTGLRITLRSDAIASALLAGADGQKQLLVEVKEQAEEYVLQLSADTLAKLTESHAGVVFRTAAGLQASIPPALLATVQLPAGAYLNFSLGAVSAAEQKAVFAAAARQSDALQPSGQAVKVAWEMVHEQKAAQLAFGHPVVVELPVVESRQEAVYRYDPADAKWAFVWNQQRVSGSRAAIEAASSGTYAVMAYADPFGDTTGHWASTDIGWMARRLLVSGAAPGAFHPDRPVTRAEFAALLVRALDLKPIAAPGYQGFSDVPEDAWYAADVRTAAEAGLLQGVADHRFAPDAWITREQMAVLIWRANLYLREAARQQEATAEALQQFKDQGSISSWAEAAAAAAMEAGLIQGTAADTFEPQGSATRAQAAVMIKRLLQLGSGQ
ncbi:MULTISPECIES: S-layer homology domain-containing protein [Paenibacillus]|uniref:S-layer homology domain-containing protein n=1 Tax=Paenibacillus TaxID=44249 RepID=UPI0022B88162|nr:S-layer homology domain-containing protein [Paenibacillus caseinilyticus]MCZ8523409.1 S-layer homology domain-containing protein [Paenibacillus caseinilyticus]